MSLKKDLIDKQARFWVLMAGGATLTAASETAGVSRATGRKWRQATGGRIPRRRPEPSGRYLSLEERLQIADLYLGGVGVRAIAVGIGHRKNKGSAVGRPVGLRLPRLQEPQGRRTRLQPRQELARPGHPLRQTRPRLPSRRRPRIDPALAVRTYETRPRFARPVGERDLSRRRR